MNILSKPDIDLIKKVFFLGMMSGYVGGSPNKRKIAELPGSRMITFEHYEDNQHFIFNDLYFVTFLSDYSHGVTSISLDGQPVWMMSYEGMYRANEISLLKEALKYSYERKRFVGGRGPSDLTFTCKYTYHNEVHKPGFEDFSGEERIVNSLGVRVGWHNYRGRLLA